MEVSQAMVLLASACWIGACIASFTSCAAQRYIVGGSALKGHSHCDTCGHILNALDIFPIVGWIIRGGKCHYCHKRIPMKNLVEEAMLAIEFGFIFMYMYSFQFSHLALIRGSFIALVCVIAIIDIEIEEVPYTTWGLMIVMTAMGLVITGVTIAHIFLTAFILTLVYYIRNKMGHGDIIILILIPYLFSVWVALFTVLIMSVLSLTVLKIEEKFHTSVLVKTEQVDLQIGIRMVPCLAVALLMTSICQTQIDYFFLV